MARLKILFADDQIPDDSIPDDEIKTRLKEQHKDWDTGFINAFHAMRQSVNTLRNSGYNITVARTYQNALELIAHEHFDIAIVDLGWFADETLAVNHRSFAGWDICEAIDTANNNSATEPTLQIIYSNRFVDDAMISIQAADTGKLPVFKNYKKATHEALRASVKFIETHITSPSSQEQLAISEAKSLHQAMINALNEPLKQLKSWSMLAVVFIALSLLLLLAGASLVIFLGKDLVGAVTSLSSIFTGAISALLLSRLRETEKTFLDNLNAIREEHKQAIGQLQGQ